MDVFFIMNDSQRLMEEHMRKSLVPMLSVLIAVSLGLSLIPQSALSASKADVKEWTLLVFLNGHNNLDSFGAKDINEMEKVGSSDQVNVVVQWASMKNRDTRRLYVQRDASTTTVTSPVVQSMPRVDMGDPRNFVEFVRWGMENYPAKKYFVDVWDHGSGWHLSADDVQARDISWDDYTGNSISTEELGQAVRELRAITGQKISLYGSDACLMAMAEVGSEIAEGAEFMVGSQDLEPGDGWPYDGILSRLGAKADASAQELGAMVVEAYVASYSGGSQGRQDVTQSVVNLERSKELHAALAELGTSLRLLGKEERTRVIKASVDALNFYYADYVDLGDFVSQLEKSRIPSLDSALISNVRQAIDDYVVSSSATGRFQAAQGISVWVPNYKSTYNRYIERYRGLSFHQETAWGDTLQYLLQDL